ncbi:MAG: hypothetical protein AB7H97_04835 [Pseudobdellovibrionaceae bacterium]
MAQFQKEKLRLLSIKEILTNHPQLIESLALKAEASSPQEKAFVEIQNLIIAAYKGKPLVELASSYKDILKTLPAQESQGLDERLPVHCNAREIISSIGQKK